LLPLKNGELTLVDDDIFYALSQFKWMRDGTKNNAVTGTSKIQGERRLHRIIMNAPKDKEVDHIDGNVLNNQRANLRICTRRQNARNRKKNKNSKSPYKGVQWLKEIKMWQAKIRIDGKLKALGIYKTAKNAARAYNKAAIKHFGLYAKINKI